MSGRKGMGHYSAATKEEAVRLFLEEWITYHAIAERLGIRNAERIEAWVRAYRREGELGLHKSKGRPRKKQDQAAYIAWLEMENALLKNSTGSYTNSQNRSPLPSDLLSSREKRKNGLDQASLSREPTNLWVSLCKPGSPTQAWGENQS